MSIFSGLSQSLVKQYIVSLYLVKFDLLSILLHLV